MIIIVIIIIITSSTMFATSIADRCRRHLVNAYKVKAGMVFVAGKTVRAMPERFKAVRIPCKCSALPFYLLPFNI